MGRSASQRPTKPQKSKKQKLKGQGKRPSVASPEVLVERAQDAIGRDDFDTALALLGRATEQDSANPEYHDMYGSLLAECGQPEKAVEVLRRAVQLSPDEGHEKYMYLSQLLAGEGATVAAAKGVDILDTQLGQLKDKVSAGEDPTGECAWMADEIASQLSQAICSHAEILMALSAADMEPVAEEVETLLTRAEDIDPSNPEPMQAMCSLRVEQGRPDEALGLLEKSLSKWFRADEPKDTEMEPGTSHDKGVEPFGGLGSDDEDDGDDDAEEEEDVEEESNTPSYEFRIESAKLLLELDKTTDRALEILVQLLSENDNVPDTWHLYAMCLHASGSFEEGLKAIEDAKAMCTKIGMPADDVVMLSFDELAASIKDSMGAEA